MPKLPVLKPREVIHALERAGFIFERQKGSHKIYIKNNHGVTVPDHSKDLRQGTLKHIIKQSGLELKEFLKFL